MTEHSEVLFCLSPEKNVRVNEVLFCLSPEKNVS